MGGAHDQVGSGAAPMLPPQTPRAWGSATEPELIVAQILAIDAWHRAWPIEGEAASAAQTRESRLERNRQMATLRAVQDALREHAARHLAEETSSLLQQAPARAVVASRDPWFQDALCAALEDYGIVMAARLSNGAEALGVTIAEQPDLLLVEDAMSFLRGEDALRGALEFAPRTLVVVRVSGAARAAALEAAGADAVIPRNAPPVDVAHDLAALVAAHRALHH